MTQIGRKLLASESACWDFYTKESVEALMA
jgi:hypothetical protein